jgi:dihydrofolate reductase
VIFGSPHLSQLFARMGLIDEYQLTVNPVILGQGIPLFKDIKDQTKLKLLESKTFNSGVLGLHYQTDSKE